MKPRKYPYSGKARIAKKENAKDYRAELCSFR